MCGIAGILYFNGRDADPAVIGKMTDALSHRGPDAGATLAEGPLAFGHRRLSIIDLSSAANQPFHDVTGRYVIVFNGEIYNYEEVKARISDYPFQTTSDTEVLVAAYAKWGPECLHQLRGMFAFALWDRQERSLFIARDRMGVKPLYYYQDDDKLLFASEIRSILTTGQLRKEINEEALIDLFSYQSVGGTHSIIKGIRQLEAGCWMKIKGNKTIHERYWDVTHPRVDFDFGDVNAVRSRIRELMLQSVKRRLVADVPVGAFLSGGIDSSAVVGLMAEASAQRPATFNISFEEKEYDESYYAEMVAKKFKADHTRILLQPTIFLDEMNNALNAMDTPSGDGINTYVVSKAIRQKGMTVALSGVGGDELFAGYPYFNQYMTLQARSWLWKWPAIIRRQAALIEQGPRRERLRQLLEADSCSIDRAYPVFRQMITPAKLSQLITLNGHAGALKDLAPQLTARKDDLRKLPLLSQVSAAEYLGYTQHTLLKDTDQMSMAVALEVREPFFDHDLVEFVLCVPDAVKRPVYPKSLLVESLKPLLPDDIVHRPKQGFLFPWNTWMKNELRGFCEQHLNNMAGRSFINGPHLLQFWKDFLAGKSDIRWGEIWLFVVLDHWMEKNGVV
ncbi:MAG TPA: asparagine synthase (glutamine-hydrolyzing) [Puia sp.]